MIRTSKLLRWSQPGRACVLVGGSFGSEGKGSIAAWLTYNEDYQGRRAAINWSTTNAGAQAGHTTQFLPVGAAEPTLPMKFICYHMPTCAAWLSQSGYKPIAYLNGGSIIDPEQLKQELADLDFKGTVIIHPYATLITDEDREAERAEGSSVQRIASTMKGVGSALSRKIMRRAAVVKDRAPEGYQIERVDLNALLATGNHGIMVEVPQGFGLSINHGYRYPASTSRDCWVGSGISDAGIHPSLVGAVCMVVRSRPIRVGNVVNEKGEKLGDSGPFYPGSYEMDWARDLPGVTPERTTVTKRIRRIAMWSDQQYYEALSYNRPSIVALTFCDYLSGKVEFLAMDARMKAVEAVAGLHDVGRLWAVGPNLEDIMPERDQVVAWMEKNR